MITSSDQTLRAEQRMRKRMEPQLREWMERTGARAQGGAGEAWSQSSVEEHLPCMLEAMGSILSVPQTGVGVQFCNLSTPESEARVTMSLRQPGLHRKF